MSNRIVLLISLLLVLATAVTSQAALEGWWPLDGDANDVSGRGRHGTLMGDPMFEDGIVGQAIAFDGTDDYVNIDGYKGIIAVDGVQQAFSIANWFKIAPGASDSDVEMVTWGTSAGRTRLTWRVHQGRLRTEHGSGNLRGNTYVDDNEWHHGALVVNEGANLQVPNTLLYVDGQQDTTFSGSNNTYELGEGADVSIGRRADNATRYWPGSIDEVMIFSRTLSDAQVQEAMNGIVPVWPGADKGRPFDGSVIEDVLVTLSWRGGSNAVSHNVYFGTTIDLGPDQLVSQQTETEYMVYGLAAGTTYYWRIDEVAADGIVTTGDVWSFSTPPAGAYNPDPADAMLNAAIDVTLSWTASWSPAMYGVYFGTDADAVAKGAGAAAQMDATFDPGPLATSTTYYWRVDVLYSSGWYKGQVWSFTTLPDIPPVEDSNLITWWPLNEAGGVIALDMSGHSHHGTFLGDPQWAGGIDDGALEFDGVDDQVEHLLPEATTFPSFTVALWVKASSVGQAQYSSPFSSHTPNSAGLQIDVDGSDPGVYRINPPGGTQLVFGPVVTDWVHLALVGEGISMQFYYNGSLATTGDVTDTEVLINQFVLGAARSRSTFFAGTIDDFRYYDRALSADEVKQLTRTDPAQAWDPMPAGGATGDIWTLSMLSWMPGDGAVEHDVYFGTDAAAVEAADATDATGIYRGRQADAAFIVPEGLEFATSYFWRVDEVAADGTVTAGRIWSLTTLDEIVIYAEETPFPYDNTAEPYLSEISLDMDPALNLNKPIGRFAISYTGAAAGGSVTVDDAAGTVTVVGRGADIWGTADQFQYAYTMLTGDGSMTVKVDSLAHTDNWSKAGIMIRETLDAGSPFAAVYATGTNGVRFQARTMADQDATSDTSVATDEQKALNAPVWLKIERAFPMMNAYYSTDGTTWTPMSWNPQVIPLTPAPVYIGLAVTSHSGDTTFAEAVFSELSSEGGVAAGPLTSTEVGLVSNSAEPMYLVLEDASGASAAVMNPDPAATQQTSATDWIVDLGQYAIDLSAVTKATLVIGNLDAPAPGGKGELMIHNVRLLPWLPHVIFVSFHGADDAPSTAAADVGFTEASDIGYTNLLKANGYNVTRYITSSNPEPEILNAADLVIISRAVSSGGYSNDGATAWNNISAPMMILGGYVLRNSRMGYTTGGTMVDTTGDVRLTVSDPAHPIFAGVALTDGTMDNPYAQGAVVLPTDGVTISRGISINNNPADDEGTVLATIAEASADTGPVGGLVIAEWPAGATLEHSGGAGTDVLAGPRLVFLTGSREPSGVTGGDAAGLYDLYADGELMFLNAVDYMIE